jgi:predicted AlkP superfamily pyrophosphatase or phosphodiesterase
MAVAPAARGQQPALADHVVLVSIDGLRPDFYLDPAWPAPTLQQMALEGTHANAVRSVFPSVTYPSHTTMITGALPARHGVFYNTPFERAGQTGRWYWETSSVRVPTLWDAVRAAGKRSAAVSWPVTVGAPIDWNVPEVWSLDREADPTEAMRRATTGGLWTELEREATGRLTAAALDSDYLAREDRIAGIAAHLLATHRPALLAVHLIGTDHFQHEQGRDGPMVRRAVGAVDRALGRLVDAAAQAGILERTAFVVTGDHGFVDIHTRISPNVWLAEAGMTGTAPDRGRWRATFHTSGGAAFLHVNSVPGVETLSQRVRDLLGRVPAGQRKLFRIVERDELDAIGADPAVPFALTGVPGVIFSASAEGPALAPASGGTHGYYPDFPEIHTGFVGWGAGIEPGAVAPLIGLEDVAPMIAALLGLRLEAPDGVLPAGLLRRPR